MLASGIELLAMMLQVDILSNVVNVIVIAVVVILLGILILLSKWYRKAIHGKALVRTGAGGTRVSFDKGFFVIPVFHRLEVMDITIKTVTISRTDGNGLICMDNLRADIKVAFFVRVNRQIEEVKKVALSIGCERASDQKTLENLFEAKFSEALKTVGKKFEFVELYNSRERFKKEILQTIGKDLNGYWLDDVAIDYLEQTPLDALLIGNILDVQGIRKIEELTAGHQVEANLVKNEKEKTINKQNVEAREVILKQNRQLAEKEEQQRREIQNIKDKEQAAIDRVAQEQWQEAETARIKAEQAVEVAEQDKQRQVIINTKNKERTDAVESERVEKDRMLEVVEREQIGAG